MDSSIATLVSLGWLWFDNDPKTSLEDKVGLRRGALSPEVRAPAAALCYVSQKTLGEHACRRPGTGLQRAGCGQQRAPRTFPVRGRETAA